MSLSLYVIETALEVLAEAREEAVLKGDSEALKVIDDQIAQYLTKEAAKIDSYAGLIRRSLDEAAILKAEAARLADRAKAAQEDAERLKKTALVVMEQFGVKELKTPRNTLRVQANGGLEPLEIDLGDLPEEYTIETWEFRNLDQDEKIRLMDAVIKICGTKTKCLPERENTEAIREALKQHAIPGAKLLERGKHVRVL